MTQPGIDPGTVRLVAQRLNHYDIYIYIYIARERERVEIISRIIKL